jgi:hypothetical protein
MSAARGSMKICLESNLRLLRFRDIDGIDRDDCPEISVCDLLRTMSHGLTKTPKHLTDCATHVDGLFQAHVDSRMPDLYEDCVHPALRDGDTAAIGMSALESRCGEALPG